MSWFETSLGDCCDLYQPQTITTKELKDNGLYPVYGANGVIGRYDRFNHVEPQLLVTCRGATCGAVNISSAYSWINGNAMVVKPKTKELNIRFLEYFFRGAADLSRAITGAAQPQITRQSLSPVRLTYPPLSTQQKIVEKLDAIFAEIDKATAAAEANIKNAEALFQSYLTQVFEEGGEGWVEKPLKEISKVINGFAFKSQDFILSSGVKAIKISNVGVGRFLMDDEEFLPKSYADQYSSFAVPTDSIVIPLTRTIINGGLKVAIVPDEYNGALLNQRVAAILANKKIIDSKLIYYYLLSKVVKNYVISNVNALMQPNLSIKDLLLLPVPIPSINEQSLILEKLENIKQFTNDIKLFATSKNSELAKLKASILQSAFNGKLVKE